MPCDSNNTFNVPYILFPLLVDFFSLSFSLTVGVGEEGMEEAMVPRGGGATPAATPLVGGALGGALLARAEASVVAAGLPPLVPPQVSHAHFL